MKENITSNNYIAQFVGNMIDDNLVEAKKSLEGAIMEKFTDLIKTTSKDLNKE
jgi:hypothetical protein